MLEYGAYVQTSVGSPNNPMLELNWPLSASVFPLFENNSDKMQNISKIIPAGFYQRNIQEPHEGDGD